jgi:hypothetical protein
MEVGGAFRDKFQPALADFGATGRTRAEAFARALREGDDTAAKALGRSSASLNDVLNPLQADRLKLIGEQLARRANAEDLGRAVGSNTAQNLVSQNVVRQFFGPLGLPESMMERVAQSTLMQSILRPVQFAGQMGEPKAMQALQQALLDPKLAQQWLKLGVNPQQVGLLLKNQQYLPGAAAAAGLWANTPRE